MPGDRPVIKSRFRSTKEWSDWINAHAVEDTEPNRTVLRGHSRPATREELIEFVKEQNARHAERR